MLYSFSLQLLKEQTVKSDDCIYLKTTIVNTVEFTQIFKLFTHTKVLDFETICIKCIAYLTLRSFDPFICLNSVSSIAVFYNCITLFSFSNNFSVPVLNLVIFLVKTTCALEAQVALHIVLLVMCLCVVIACCNHFYFEGSAKRKNKRILPGNRMLLSTFIYFTHYLVITILMAIYVLSFNLKSHHFHQSYMY